MGYRVLVSQSPGVHPTQTTWNGRLGAFSFTTDDGNLDNMKWAEIFNQYGVKFTAFVTSGYVGAPRYPPPMSVEDLNTFHEMGHEIGAHSVSHPYLTTDRAFRLRYVGPADSCQLIITDKFLKTVLSGETFDLSIWLADWEVRYLDQLVSMLDALPDYECVLDHYTIHGQPTESRWCDPIPDPGADIKAAPFQVTTQKGCNLEELQFQVTECKTALEDWITDADYVCRTFAYPFHMHDQREMDAVMGAGYVAARNGFYNSARPWAVPGPIDQVNVLRHVNTFEKPITCASWNDAMDEQQTRNGIRMCLEILKSGRSWGVPYIAHTLADYDSIHTVWLIEELLADPDIWFTTFDSIASYSRQFAISVGNPIVPGSNPPVCRVTLSGFDFGVTNYAVVQAYDVTYVNGLWSDEVEFGEDPSGGGETSVADANGAGSSGALSFAEWPNPVRDSARFSFALPGTSKVSLRVYDAAGRVARRVLDGEVAAGPHVTTWDGTDDDGRALPSGVYFYSFATPNDSRMGKLLLMR